MPPIMAWPVVRRMESRRKRIELALAAVPGRRLDMNTNEPDPDPEAHDTEPDTEPWSPTMTPPGSVEPIVRLDDEPESAPAAGPDDEPEIEDLGPEESAAKARIMARYPDTWDDSIPLAAPWPTFYREREQELQQTEDGSGDFPFVVDETQAPAPETDGDGSQQHPFVFC